MKNIINEKPEYSLSGRLLSSINYVNDLDIKNKTVLNIGCGYGWCELNFLNRGVKKMIGCEITENDLKTAKDNVKDKRVDFVVASALKLPFPDNTFDTVVSWEVIEHIPKNSESKMLSEIKRVLKPQGKLFLSTPHTSFISNIFDPAWWLIGHRHYSINQLEKYIKICNLSLLDVQVRGRLWTILSSISMYFSKWVLRRKNIFNNFFKKKVNKEYQESGYVNIFIIAKKNE